MNGPSQTNTNTCSQILVETSKLSTMSCTELCKTKCHIVARCWYVFRNCKHYHSILIGHIEIYFKLYVIKVCFTNIFYYSHYIVNCWYIMRLHNFKHKLEGILWVLIHCLIILVWPGSTIKWWIQDLTFGVALPSSTGEGGGGRKALKVFTVEVKAILVCLCYVFIKIRRTMNLERSERIQNWENLAFGHTKIIGPRPLGGGRVRSPGSSSAIV